MFCLKHSESFLGGFMKELDYLKKLISIKSFDLLENKEIIDYLYSKFSKIVKEIVLIKNDNNDKVNMLIGVNTKLKNVTDALVLSGHIDTVFANEKDYLTNPYEGVIIGDKIYGLGSIDMKSFFACILTNLKKLKSYNIPIIIAISSDEETELFGVKKITEKMRELNIKPKLTIVGEPTNSDICTKGKSCLAYKISVMGKSCHSSTPQNGINANYVLARLVLYIEKLCGKFKDTTTSCNIILGGKTDNIICDKSEMIFDLRSFSSKKVEKILQLINKRISQLKRKYEGVDIVIENKLDILPFECKNTKLVKEVCGLINAKERVFIGGCEAGYYRKLGGDAIVFGVGELSLAHKPNEYAEIDELNLYFEKLEKILSTI